MYAALKSLPAGSMEDEIYSALSIAPNIHRASGLGQNSNQPDGTPGLDSTGGRAGPIYRSAAVVIKSNKGKRDDRFGRLRPTKCHVAPLLSLSFFYYKPSHLSASIYTVTFPLRSSRLSSPRRLSPTIYSLFHLAHAAYSSNRYLARVLYPQTASRYHGP